MSEKKNENVNLQIKNLTEHQHLFLRPSLLIGANDRDQKSSIMLMLHPTKNAGIYERSFYIYPLMKIIDEAITNSIDNALRNQKPNQTYIKISIINDPTSKKYGVITIENDGAGIPIILNKEFNKYSVELAFSQERSGSNFDESKEIKSGQFGIGIKTTNFLSDFMNVENWDIDTKQIYTQSFMSNPKLFTIKEPKISENKKITYGLVKIEFKPNYKWFFKNTYDKDSTENNIKTLIDNAYIFLYNRAYEAKFTVPNIKIIFNENEIVGIESFSDYIKLFIPEEQELTKIVKYIDTSGWTVILTHPITTGEITNHSFVNGINVPNGSHIKLIQNKILNFIRDKFSTRSDLTESYVMNRIFIFISAYVRSPIYRDGNRKMDLATAVGEYINATEFTKFLNKAYKHLNWKELFALGANEIILDSLSKELNIAKNKFRDIQTENYFPASNKTPSERTLVIVEGLSAKSMIMTAIKNGSLPAGKYGVYALRGKVANPLKGKSIEKDEILIHLLNTIGLGVQKSKKKDSRFDTLKKNLKYQHIIMMTDQDTDGFHIRGLLINLIYFIAPTLLEHNCANKFDFLSILSTPLIRITKRKTNETKNFYTEKSFKEWSNGKNTKDYIIQYYKGLGTTSDAEIKEFFKTTESFTSHLTCITIDSKAEESLKKAFGKETEERKIWLNEKQEDEIDLYNKKEIEATEFINKQLFIYSTESNVRAFPSLFDGLKPGQRKILFVAFQNFKDMLEKPGEKLKGLKMTSLIGQVTDKAQYHHGSASLEETIMTMARNFVGNNLPMLKAVSNTENFGSRWDPREFSAARYMYVGINELMIYLYPQEDNKFLKYEKDDGVIVEPTFYVPILPAVLLYGIGGIGTGWSTIIPSYDIKQLINITKKILNEEKLENIYNIKEEDLFKIFIELKLKIYGFTGRILKVPEKQIFRIIGSYSYDSNKGEIFIKDPPPIDSSFNFMSVKKYIKIRKLKSKKGGKSDKKKVEDDEDTGKKGKQYSKFYEDEILILITPSESGLAMKGIVKQEYRKKFAKLNTLNKDDPELINILSEIGLCVEATVNNINVIDENKGVMKVNDLHKLYQIWFNKRQELYEKRYKFMFDEYNSALSKLENIIRFIEMYNDDKIIISKKTKENIIKQLKDNKFITIDESYDYLLNISLYQLTLERMEKLIKEFDNLKAEFEKFKNNDSWKTLWFKDLGNFEKYMNKEKYNL